ncbi:MAG TPA: hypothetical protein VJV79_40720 [Polyangiaceae bacterium]|nr:hypothetical protein [Polyangiaceae bacterium]
MHERSGTSGQVAQARSGRKLLFGVLFGISGALLGGMAGNLLPAIIGALLGAVLGALAGWSVHAASVGDAWHDASLDRTIGTDGGSIGVPGLEHPPFRIGAPSKAASGVSSPVEEREAAGPILRPPE